MTEKKISEKPEQKIKGIIRIAGADIKGHKNLEQALIKVKGISHNLANVIIKVINLPHNKKAGSLTKEEIAKIEDIIKNPKKYKIPSWMLNRRKDIETGEDKHISSSELEITNKMDLKRLVEIKSYRGLRLSWGLPVRGQRTKAGYTHPPRRTKRRGNVVGVSKRKQQPQKKKKESSSKLSSKKGGKK